MSCRTFIQMADWKRITAVDDCPPQTSLEIVVDGAVIALFNVDGQLFALDGICPHQGGPVCHGRILKKVEEVIMEDKTSKGLTFSPKHTHVVCPWHGFEFNIRTGRHPGDRNAVLTPVEVKIRNHDVFVIV